MGQDRALGAPRAALLRGLSAAAAGALLGACVRVPALVPRRDPLSAREHRALGEAYEVRGQREQAAAQYKAATELAPGDADAWVALGNVAAADGDWEKAAGLYRRALGAVPRHVGATNNLAFALMNLGRLEEAERLAHDALSRGGPLRVYVLDTLANVYLRQGRTADALKTLDLADAAGTKDPLVREQLLKTRQGVAAARPAAGSGPRRLSRSSPP